jgi:hypothetical protein
MRALKYHSELPPCDNNHLPAHGIQYPSGAVA